MNKGENIVIHCIGCPFKNDILEKADILVAGKFIVIKSNYLHQWHALMEDKFSYNNLEYDIVLLENSGVRKLMIDAGYKKNLFSLDKEYIEEIFTKNKKSLFDMIAIRYLCNCKK